MLSSLRTPSNVAMIVAALAGRPSKSEATTVERNEKPDASIRAGGFRRAAPCSADQAQIAVPAPRREGSSSAGDVNGRDRSALNQGLLGDCAGFDPPAAEDGECRGARFADSTGTSTGRE